MEKVMLIREGSFTNIDEKKKKDFLEQLFEI
jgi:hypothetical protein